MIVTIAPMVNPDICEPPYFLKILNYLENDLDEVVFADIFEPVTTVFKVVNNYIYIVSFWQ